MNVPLYCPTAAETGCRFSLDITNATTRAYLDEHMRRMHPDVPFTPSKQTRKQRNTIKLPSRAQLANAQQRREAA